MAVMIFHRSSLLLCVTLCALMSAVLLPAQPAYAASAPVVEDVWASAVNRSTAHINALINPSEADTTYTFEYGPTSSYGSAVPVPDGDLGSGTEPVKVEETLTGLQPGATYHFRVVATNSAGTTTGEDEYFSTFPPPTTESADTCPNAQYRVDFSAGLPDCRAYEMVSPVEKYGGEVSGEAFGQTLGAEGDGGSGEPARAVFTSKTGFGEVLGSGNAGYTQYVAERGPTGWTTSGITPATNVENGGQIFGGKTELMEFSPDLNLAALIGYSLPESPAGARPERENLYLESTATAKLLAAITDGSNEGEPVPYPPIYISLFGLAGAELIFGKPVLGGASADMKVVTFMSRVNFTPEAHGMQFKAYVYENGAVKLLGVLPDGSVPPEGSELVYGESLTGRGADGRAIEDKDTVSTDGSRALFVAGSPSQLFMRKNGATTVLVSESETSQPATAESVVLEAATPDLKHIVFRSSTQLLDSAPEYGGLYMYTDGPDPATETNLTFIGQTFVGEEDPVLGISEDGSRIYYNESSVINLWEAGQTLQVASGSGGEARVSADGQQLAFTNNEMYVYNENANTLTCVSCPGTHAAASTGIGLGVEANSGGTYLSEPYRPRFMSSDGRYVFFNTTEALVPQDTNGVMDAYEYDTSTGRLSLLSSGTGEDGTWFVDASASGNDAYLVTRQKLTGWDPDKLVDLYDARVGGGFPEPPPATEPCDGDACQGTPSAAPTFNTASGFIGPGNPAFAKSGTNKSGTNKSGTNSTGAGQKTRLHHALAVCGKKDKGHKRARCERLARRRFGGSARKAQVACRTHNGRRRPSRCGSLARRRHQARHVSAINSRATR